MGGKIYCYGNFYCYSIVFGPNFREGQKFSRGGGANCLKGAPPPWEKASQHPKKDPNLARKSRKISMKSDEIAHEEILQVISCLEKLS